MLTLYVLRLEHDCYYVGTTTNLKYRLEQHRNGQGSVWTKKHKMLATVKVVENVGNFDEDKYVKIYMAEYGIDKVRGGSYVTTDLPDYQLLALKKELITSSGACFNCGKPGHYANNCKVDLTKSEVTSTGPKLYVLRLENDCYYIGITTNLDHRLKNQLDGKGAIWVKKHKPLELVHVIDDIKDINVNQFVKSYMAKFGIDKVRGGSYTRVDLGKNKFKMLQMELGCNIEPKVVNIDGSKIVDVKQQVAAKVDIIPKVVEVKIKPKVVKIEVKPKMASVNIDKIIPKVVNINKFVERKVTVITLDDIVVEYLVKVSTIVDDVEELEVKIFTCDIGLLDQLSIYLSKLKFW